MKLFVAVLCLCLSASALSMTMSDDSCYYSPWRYFKSMLGMEFMSMAKKVAMMKMKGNCLNIEIPDEMKEACKTCGIETAIQVLTKLNEKPAPKKLDLDDLKFAHNVFLVCHGNALYFDTDARLDLQDIKNKLTDILTAASKDEETETALLKAMNECGDKHIDGGIGEEALTQITEMEICFIDGIIEHCKEVKKDPGFIVRAKKTMLRLVTDPKCEESDEQDD